MKPKLPNYLAITLSSKLFIPNRLDCLTSFKHLPHLCTAYLVNPTSKGIIKRLIIPKMRIAKTAKR